MTSSTPAPRKASSLTERRKAATRMEIARAAAGLFVTQGLRATRAEDIAQAAGIAPRTFYRYFATKEEAVAPLYAEGAQRWTDAVREAPAGLPVIPALAHAVRHTFIPSAGVSAASWQWARTLIRLAGTDPAVRKVWAEECQAAERTLAEVLAARTAPRTGDDNVAPTAAVSAGTVATTVTTAISPELRFAAAVASAAVRVAVEAWAIGEARAEGPEGPVALALRNLATLRDFTWETGGV
ncbi:TetR/AcrR family transcriptional regulator [Streptomyces sp. NPDC020801]|uniref:TetR/AcrR family transcriptional regulator n=1 Tax=unclassified Streptomyces TaxID=2593676 RepID=UPI00379FEF63